jgi:hypothetical protein
MKWHLSQLGNDKSASIFSPCLWHSLAEVASLLIIP